MSLIAPVSHKLECKRSACTAVYVMSINIGSGKNVDCKKIFLINICMHLKYRCSFAISSFENMIQNGVCLHLSYNTKKVLIPVLILKMPSSRFNNEFS